MNTQALLLLGAAVALVASRAKAAPKDGAAGEAGPDANAAPGSDFDARKAAEDVAKGADDLLKAVTGTGLTGTLAAGVKGLLAGGGTAGASTATAGTVGATGGTAGAGAGTGTAAGGTGGTAAASPASIVPQAVTLGAGGVMVIAIAVTIVVLVVLDQIFKGTRSIEMKLNGLLPNARDLHRFEQGLLEDFKTRNNLGGSLSTQTVGDVRLEFTFFSRDENKTYRLTGERTVYSYVPNGSQQDWMGGDSPNVAWLRVQKQMRRLGREYLYWRGFLANNVFQGRRNNYNRPWDWSYWGGQVYEGMRGYETESVGYGGLDNLPLLDGQTVFSRDALQSMTGMTGLENVLARRNALKDAALGRPVAEKDAKALPADRMVARDAAPDEAFVRQPGGSVLLAAMRLKALLEVCQTYFPVDDSVLIDPAVWIQNVALPWLGLPESYVTTAPKVRGLEGCIITTPEFTGVRVAIDLVAIRLKKSNPTYGVAWMLRGDVRYGDLEYYTPVSKIA